jgi:hypothetical protein
VNVNYLFLSVILAEGAVLLLFLSYFLFPRSQTLWKRFFFGAILRADAPETGGSADESRFRLVQVFMPFVQTLIISMVTVVLAWSVYGGVSLVQNNIARLNYLNSLDNEMMELQDERTVSVCRDYSPDHLYRLRNALGVTWTDLKPVPPLPNFRSGDNWVMIQATDKLDKMSCFDGSLPVTGETRIQSKSLHGIMIWFMKVQRGLELGVIQPEDLLPMWRQILVFSEGNRTKFLKSYFTLYQWRIAEDVEALTMREIADAKTSLAFPKQDIPTVDREFLSDEGLTQTWEAISRGH